MENNVCTIEELREIVRELNLSAEDLDNIEALRACGSGGVCQIGCQPGCQACQPGNRFGKRDTTEDESE